MLENLKKDAAHIGKEKWRDLLNYCADQHEKNINPAGPFPYPWEEIGKGYCYAPAFGHWDIAHIIMDEYEAESEHAKEQIRNNLAYQLVNGMIPGVFTINDGYPQAKMNKAYPPMWIFAVDALFERTGDKVFLKECLDALLKNMEWWEKKRRAENGGYFYMDYVDNHHSESGIDEGVRFIRPERYSEHKLACVDATAHSFAMQDFAKKWMELLNQKIPDWLEVRLNRTRQEVWAMFDKKTGWFYDSWQKGNDEKKPEFFEGIWPVTCGAATMQQAGAVMKNLMDENSFFTPHPMPSVAINSPHFELRMWRGPVWDSMTMWEVMGLLRYGFKQEARMILERTLDSVSSIFAQTGTIWEFYDPMNGDPKKIQRKPWTLFNQPCHDYMGHAPYLWMARRFEELS